MTVNPEHPIASLNALTRHLTPETIEGFVTHEMLLSTIEIQKSEIAQLSGQVAELRSALEVLFRVVQTHQMNIEMLTQRRT